MSVRVAGQNTSIRHDEAEIKRFEVVEIPLKYDSPRCIGVHSHTGNLAIGVAKTVLVYGLCCKTVADTDKKYEDMRCLLELEFSFPIYHLSMCEEFIVCCSHTKLQVIKLNIKNVSKLNEEFINKHKDNCCQSERTESRTTEERAEISDSDVSVEQIKPKSESELTDSLRNKGSDSGSDDAAKLLNQPSQPIRLLDTKSVQRSDSSAGNSLSNQDSTSLQTMQSKASIQTGNYLVEDEHHVEFYTGKMSGYMKDKALQKRTSEHGKVLEKIYLYWEIYWWTTSGHMQTTCILESTFCPLYKRICQLTPL